MILRNSEQRALDRSTVTSGRQRLSWMVIGPRFDGLSLDRSTDDYWWEAFGVGSLTVSQYDPS